MRRDDMSLFITNLMLYIGYKKYKHSFVANLANIDLTRFNTLINQDDSITLDEMERISNALERELTFFLDPSFKDRINKKPSFSHYDLEQENYDQELNEFRSKVFQLCQNFAIVVGAKDRMMRHFQHMVEQELK